MNFQTLVIGALPPFFAIIAELANPVSEESIFRSIISGQSAQKNTDTKAAAAIANGAVKIALLVPTWISVTSGLAAAFIDEIEISWLIGGIAIWTAISALFGLKYFSEKNYYEYALYVPKSRFGLSGPTRVSLAIISINLAVILILLSAWFRFPGLAWREPLKTSLQWCWPSSEYVTNWDGYGQLHSQLSLSNHCP